MDAIRVAKVDRVLYSRPGLRVEGTLHLTAHHIIFKHAIETSEEQEIWVPYPLISTVVRMPQSLLGQSPIAFRSRTFEYFTLTFTRDRDASDVFDSVKELTVAASVTSLYAFFYHPSPKFRVNDGWSFYSPREEFARMGVGSRTKAWRFTDVNKDYTLCPTYPARLVVPAKISDSTLTYGAKYRSKARIPALVYLHWNNSASITRSSQPTVGLTNSRSVQDEKLVEAIFQSHHLISSPHASIPATRASSTVYGATATNIIIDARSATSGVANVARGGGTENMDYYKDSRKVYLGIENIHVMRDSLSRVAEALRDADTLLLPTSDGESSRLTSVLDRQALRRSGWLKHISGLLDGAAIIIRNVHINSSHVLIHCSDGWDRTAQLSVLSQLCLDPYYRTYRGFQVLVEKDWVSFGHRFLDRCGHLSSEKFFLTPTSDGTTETGGPQAFFASVQNKFTSPSHIKETSPVFHQFLECVRQIQRQYPTRFEFNERYLERLHYHLYSCQFGTFLFNNERERRTAEEGSTQAPCFRTHAVWDLLNSETERPLLLNPDYDAALDDRENGAGRRASDMGVLMPNPQDVRFWHELYGRTDEEMNGRIFTAQVTDVDVVDPVDGAADDPKLLNSPSAVSIPALDNPNATTLTSVTSIPQTTPRVPSPMTAPSQRLSSSVTSPELSWNIASSSPAESSSPPSISSSFSPQRPSSPRRRAIPNPTSTFAAGGMRSLWGQLSSNASAALSAVQNTYDNAAKDYVTGARPPSRQSQGQGRELQDADGLRVKPPAQSSSHAWGSSSLSALDDQIERTWDISGNIGVGNSSDSRNTLHDASLPPIEDDPWSSPTPTSTPEPGPIISPLIRDLEPLSISPTNRPSKAPQAAQTPSISVYPSPLSSVDPPGPQYPSSIYIAGPYLEAPSWTSSTAPSRRSSTSALDQTILANTLSPLLETPTSQRRRSPSSALVPALEKLPSPSLSDEPMLGVRFTSQNYAPHISESEPEHVIELKHESAASAPELDPLGVGLG